MHGRSAGMVGVAGEAQAHARLANDVGDRRNAEVLGFENRALLNVNLEEGGDVLR